MPELGTKIASQANRQGGAARFEEAAVQKTIAVALALIPYYEELLQDRALYILTTAKQHDANTLYLGQTLPGIGNILSLGLLYELHASGRLPRVQDFASAARLVPCSKASGGQRVGLCRSCGAVSAPQ